MAEGTISKEGSCESSCITINDSQNLRKMLRLQSAQWLIFIVLLLTLSMFGSSNLLQVFVTGLVYLKLFNKSNLH